MMYKKTIKAYDGRWVCLVSDNKPESEYRWSPWFNHERREDGEMVFALKWIRRIKKVTIFSLIMFVLKKRMNYIWGRINGTI